MSEDNVTPIDQGKAERAAKSTKKAAAKKAEPEKAEGGAGEKKVVAEKVEKAREVLDEKVGQVKEKLSEVTGDVGKRWQQVSDEVRREAGRASEAAREKAGVAADSVRTGYTHVRKNVGHLNEDLNDYVRDNPARAVLIAAGVGFVLGLFLRGGSRHDA